MVTRLDTTVGRLVDQLTRLGLEENTLIVFTSDNGPHSESGHETEVFKPAGPFRGMKRALYDGGIRVPLICYWPSRIEAGKVSSHVCYSGDFFQTFAELSGELCDVAKGPIDSISIVPTLLPVASQSPAVQSVHRYLYFEFYEQGSRQAVRFGDWKAIREPMIDGKVQLYNLSQDLTESQDVAASNPTVVEQAVQFMDEAHQPSERWQRPSRKGL